MEKDYFDPPPSYTVSEMNSSSYGFKQSDVQTINYTFSKLCPMPMNARLESGEEKHLQAVSTSLLLEIGKTPVYLDLYNASLLKERQQLLQIDEETDEEEEEEEEEEAAASAMPSLIGPFIASCFVFWLCDAILGLVAFMLALWGHSHVSEGKNKEAQHLSYASYGVALAGLVVGMMSAGVVVFHVFVVIVPT